MQHGTDAGIGYYRLGSRHQRHPAADIMRFDSAFFTEQGKVLLGFLPAATHPQQQIGQRGICSGIALRGAQNTQAKAGVQDIRFVSTVDTLNCSEIGYYITITAPGMETMRIKQALHTVYGEITGSCGNYTAKQLGGGYIVAFTIKNVPTDLGQITFEVTPYCIDGYGTHYDVAGTFVYENGNCITQ